MEKQVISLSVWKNRFDKALKLNTEFPERMTELYEEYKKYFLEHQKNFTNGELYAFNNLGLTIRSHVRDEDLGF